MEHKRVKAFNHVTLELGNLQLYIFFSGNEFFYRNKRSSSLHSHLFYEVHFMEAGTVDFYVNGVPYHAGENDVLIIPPGLSHSTTLCDEGSHWMSFCFSFRQTFERERDNLPEFDYYNAVYSNIKDLMILSGSNLYRNYLKDISEVIDKNIIGYDHKANAYLTILFTELTDRIVEKNPLPQAFTGSSEKGRKASSDNEGETVRKSKIDKYLNDNYHLANVSLKVLAKDLYLSEKQTSRLIYKYYNSDFKTLIRRRRLNVAADLLKSTELSIKQIADAVGYNSYNGFYSCFREYFGVKPSELYRGKIKNQ